MENEIKKEDMFNYLNVERWSFNGQKIIKSRKRKNYRRE